MVRKIKPRRAQRITESCYFYLSPPLCHSVSSVVFRNFISKISKVSGVLVTATRDTKDPTKSHRLAKKPLMRDAGARVFPPESNQPLRPVDAPDFISTDTV